MEEEKNSHILLNIFIFLVIFVILLVLYAKYIGTNGLIVKEYRLESEMLPSNFSGLKIVHFSDLLYRSTIDRDDVDDLVERINILRPDIVVFSGNLVSNTVKLSDSDIEFLKEKLNGIHANISKYYIYGEYDYDLNDYETIMNDSGFILLNNSFDEIYYHEDEPIYIVGLPPSMKDTIDLDKSFDFYKDEDRKYIMVVVHDGNTIKYLDESVYEVDLIMGGYSLNGSVVLPFYGGLFKEKYAYKYSGEEYEKGITKIFISSGLGTKKYGYRFLNKPSFNFYRLKSQS